MSVVEEQQITDLSGTRYLPVEHGGTLTLWVTKADVAVTWRGLAIVAAAATCALPLIFNFGAAPLSGASVAATLCTISVGFVLLRSSLRYARDVAGPAASAFRRVRRSVELLQSYGGEGRYREGAAAAGAVVVDGDRLDASELRAIRVLITETVETERDVTLRRTEFLPALVCERLTYELDRFAKQGGAQRFVEAFATACGRPDLIANARACPAWNPYRATAGVGLVRVLELLLWIAGMVMAMLSWPRALAALAMGAGLVIDLVITKAEGRRMGAMRSALIQTAPEPAAVASPEAAPVASPGVATTANEAPEPEETPPPGPAPVADHQVPVPEAAPNSTRGSPVALRLIGAIGAVLGVVGLISHGGCGKGLGAEATSPRECRSGMLLTGGGRSICTCSCGYGRPCPGGFSCTEEAHCIPDGSKDDGEPCAAPWECKSHHCGSTMFSDVLHARMTGDPLSQGPTQCLP